MGSKLFGTTLFAQQAITDIDILNFALNLEYLEAEFYTVATTGQRIHDIGIGVDGKARFGATTGGGKVSLDDRTMAIASQIAIDEQAHVKFLRTALRGDAVAKPAINLEARLMQLSRFSRRPSCSRVIPAPAASRHPDPPPRRSDGCRCPSTGL